MIDLTPSEEAVQFKIQNPEWVVAPESAQANTLTFNAVDIRDADWGSLAAAAVPQLESGRKPTYEDAASIFSKYIRGQLRLARSDYTHEGKFDDNEEDEDEDIEIAEEHLEMSKVDLQDTNEKEIDPLTKIASLENNLPDTKSESTEPTGAISVVKADAMGDVTIENSTSFPNGFRTEHSDLGYEPDKLRLCLEFYKQLPPEEQQKLLKEIAPYFMSFASDRNELLMVVYNLFPKGFEKLPPGEKISIAEPFLQALWDRNLNPNEDLSEWEVSEWYHMLPPEREKLSTLLGLGLDHEKALGPLLQYLSGKDDFDRISNTIGCLISPVEYPALVNSVRDILKADGQEKDPSKKLSQKAHENMIKMGKVLLGFSPDDKVEFYKSLEALYKSIKFEHYKPNQESTEYEADIIESVGSKRNLILGLGTGRHMIELEQRQKDLSEEEKNLYLGLEINPRHVQVAQETLEKLGVGDPDHVIQGSWYDIPLDPESVGSVVSNGRDIPHVETRENAKKLKKEVYRVLEPGGVFEFDVADPTKGEYYKAGHDRFMDALKMLHVPEKMRAYAEKMKIGYVADGPTIQMRYNRIVLGPEEIIELMEEPEYSATATAEEMMLPFQCIELKREDIEDGYGSEGIYYIAMKPDISKVDPTIINKIKEYNELLKQINGEIKEIVKLEQRQAIEVLNIKENNDDYETKVREYTQSPGYLSTLEEIRKRNEHVRGLSDERIVRQIEMPSIQSELKKQLKAQVEAKKVEILQREKVIKAERLEKKRRMEEEKKE